LVKCRPPDNRDPLPEELEACSVFLERQVALVDPKVIVTLGRFSMARWFPGERISRIHGQPKREDGRVVIPMYHPAAALRDGSLREVMRRDFAQIPRLLGAVQPAEAVPAATAPPPEPAAAPEAQAERLL
jgi:uracil-DNA glycosylase